MTDLDTTLLVIDDQPQFFFDDGIVESVHNLTRNIHRPEKVDANPLIKKDKPWEHFVYFGSADFALWRDADSGQFRCLYSDWNLDRAAHAAEGGSIMAWDYSQDTHLYARSEDGLNWEKPAMGLIQVDGHDTNGVLGGAGYGSVWNMTVLDDPLESNAAHRYKALHSFIPAGSPPDAADAQEIRLAYSPDGVHWTPAEELPVFGQLNNRLSDVTIATFDQATQTYLLNTRHPWHGRAPRQSALDVREVSGGPRFDAMQGVASRRNRRRIFQCESRDFVNWSTPRAIITPDSVVDNIDDSFYGMTQYDLGGQWIGFLSVFHMVDNYNEVQLVHSRDGRNWRRLAPGWPWLKPGPPGSWDETQAYGVQAIPVGDELWVYYGGSRPHHDWWYVGQSEGLQVPEVWDDEEVQYGLGLAKMRQDGFVSLRANAVREGVLDTQPFVAGGDQLIINAVCGNGGHVKVAVADQMGAILPGRGWDDCDVFSGDALRHRVTWGGDPSLPMPADRDSSAYGPPYRRLRFRMHDAELYSFRVISSDNAAR